jgi:magnesium transporter
LVLLSEVMRRGASNGHARVRLVDLAIDLAAGDYPPVRHILVAGEGGSTRALPWPATVHAAAIVVPSLHAGTLVEEEDLARWVLLKRDILDALVLDVAGQRAVRANDLWLRPQDEQLLLVGADVSPWAVLRRLSGSLLGHGADRDLLDWRCIEFLRGDPRAAEAGRDYHRVVTHLAPPQIAWLAAALPYIHAAELISLLPDGLAADVLERTPAERQTQIVAELDPGQAARVIAGMAPDAAADLLGSLDVPDAARLLETLPRDRSLAIEALLRYPPDTAGGIMTNEIVVAPGHLSVGGVLEHIRPELPRPDFVHYVYIVADEESRLLCGVATLRDLMVADRESPVADVMTRDPITAAPLESALQVAERVSDYDLNAIPVVTPEGSLVGIVTIDAALAQIAPPAWRDNLPRVFS